MMNLFYEPFPETVTIDGREYGILTNFREWFRFYDMIKDESLSSEEKIIMSLEWLEEYPKILNENAVNAVFDFYKAKEIEYIPKNDSEEDDIETEVSETPVRPPVFDWKIDAPFVIGDFRRYYGTDLLKTEYMHWWEFRCLFLSLPDKSQCKQRIMYRSTDLSKIRNKPEQQRIARIQQSIALPFEYDEDMIGAAFGQI